MKHLRLVTALALVACVSAIAADAPSSIKGYGFDWLRPKAARCESITEAVAKRVVKCERQSGAFGLSHPLQLCRIDARTEYMVFATRAICIENLETMKANAP